MKLFFILLCFLGVLPAYAQDGDPFLGRLEIGSFGDLAYERNAEGVIMKKRSEDDIRQYIIKKADESLKSSGLSVLPSKGGDPKREIVIEDNVVHFSIYDKNGDKLYSYAIQRESGYTKNEEALNSSREKAAREKREVKNINRQETKRRKELLKKIDAGETGSKTKAVK